MFKLLLNSEKETYRFGTFLAQKITSGDVITLSGELGSGKTVLARGLIQAHIDTNEYIPSPTFNLVNIYETKMLTIWHFDLYRLKKPVDIEQLGLDEALAEGFALIEWPEKALEYIPKHALNIRINMHIDEDKRQIELIGNALWVNKLKELKKHFESTG